jgi:hypothetical protein
LVDQATFDAVKESLRSRRKPPRNLDEPLAHVRGGAPLSGLLICDHCGKPMNSEGLANQRDYVCPTNKLLGRQSPCGRNAIEEMRAFRCILATLQSVIRNSGWRAEYERRWHEDVKRLAEPDSVLPGLQAEAKRVRDKQASLVDALADAPPSSRDAIHARLAELSGPFGKYV